MSADDIFSEVKPSLVLMLASSPLTYNMLAAPAPPIAWSTTLMTRNEEPYTLFRIGVRKDPT